MNKSFKPFDPTKEEYIFHNGKYYTLDQYEPKVYLLSKDKKFIIGEHKINNSLITKPLFYGNSPYIDKKSLWSIFEKVKNPSFEGVFIYGYKLQSNNTIKGSGEKANMRRNQHLPKYAQNFNTYKEYEEV